MSVAPIDLLHLDSPGSHRLLSAGDRGRPGAVRLRPDDVRRASESRAARTRAGPLGHSTPSPLAHPPRPCGSGGCARPGAPVAAGARLRGGRAAHRRSVEARDKRSQALRRCLRRSLGRAGAGAGGERPHRRRRRRGTRVLSRRPGTHGTTSRISTPRARSTPATRPECVSDEVRSSCRRVLPRSSISPPGSRRSTRSSSAAPTGSHSSTSACTTTSRST